MIIGLPSLAIVVKSGYSSCMMRLILAGLITILLSVRPSPAYAVNEEHCNVFEKLLNHAFTDKCRTASAVVVPPDNRTTDEIKRSVEDLKKNSKAVQERVNAQKEERKLKDQINRLETGKPAEEKDEFWKS